MRQIVCFFVCFLISLSAWAEDFASSSEWISLVHYQKTIFGGYKATIGSDDFYISVVKGRTDPKAELDATIKFFESDGNIEKKCLFPARYLLLKAHGLIKNDFPKCQEFEEFKRDLKPDGVTLLFTDAYMNNSSSLFGHTLFRIDTKRKGTQMLAHGVNYGAFTKGYENSFFYAIYGLLGFYQGGLTIKPYYDIINNYNNIENRDIWEYHLDLTENETDLFVAHIWEIGHTLTPYYFFSRNCSYMLLEVIDAIKPDLKLAKDFPFWTIPLDTIKAVNKKGAIDSIHYRPSRRRKIKYRLSQMNENETKSFIKLVKENQIDFDHLSDDEKADVLETAYQYVQYQYVAKKLELTEYRKQSFQILRQRNQNKTGQFFEDIKEGNDPVLSHDSKAVAFSLGTQNGRVFEELRLRPAYHSLTDNTKGYLKGAAINFLESVFRHYDRHDRYVLEKLNVLELDSFSPIDRLFQAPSYRIFVDIGREYNLKKKKTGHVLNADVDFGGTYAVKESFWIYALSGLKGGYGGFLKDNAFAGVSFAGGVLYSGDQVSLQAQLKKAIASQKQGSVFEQSAVLSVHLVRNTDLEAKFLRKTYENKSLNEVTFGLKQFF